MFAPAYFDHNATTPVDVAVLEAMLPYLGQRFGNASSRHDYGRTARRAVDEARQRVAMAVGAHPTEVIFTSGGSEANNLFLRGAAECMKPGVVTVSAVEHPCVREPARWLAKRGWTLHEIAVDSEGRIDCADFQRVLENKPRLWSVMLANNETGVLQDVPALAEAARGQSSGGWFHTDAVQALGKVAVDFRSLNGAGVHAMSVSAHKIGGPKGAGALVVDKRVELAPQILGGGHERGLRSGTENVPAIVGFGLACELAGARREARQRHVAALRGRIEKGLHDLGATLFGAAVERLPNTIYFALPEIDGETLVGRLDRAGFACASGAACSSANPEPSHVLLAMGVDSGLARGAVRVSLGPDNTEQQAAEFLVALRQTVNELKGMTALA
ncbi:MAG: cysteine desulfurase [Rhodocyclaceae bacterium]|nr:cysteine desulfurase [Rhodocyclaceae bacterium]